MKKFIACLICLLLPAVFTGCVGLPMNIKPVNDFELDRYLGHWYEIARLDHSFEKGLSRVSAEYTMRPDGGVKVVNSGFFSANGEWNDAEGKAYFVDDENTGHLKVSFFGPFYGSYIIFELDHENYQYAFVTSSNKSYLWFLSRTPVVDKQLKDHFIQQIKYLGFDADQLIFVNQ